MHKTIPLVLCAMTLAAAFMRADDEVRTWTSSSGATLEAAFVGVDGTLVKLRAANGKMMGIPMMRLSPADRAWVAEQAPAAEPPAAEPAAAEPAAAESGQEIKALRAFTEGDWKGYNAFYTERNFDAGLAANGEVVLFLKNRNGERVGEPLRMLAQYVTRDPVTGQYKTVGAAAFLDDPDPVKSAREVTWHRKLADGMQVETGVAFSRTGIEMWSAPVAKELPADAPHAFVAVRAPKTFTIGHDMKVEEKKKIAGKATLVIHPDSGTPFHLAYYDRRDFPNAADRIEIEDLYESRTISFKAASPRHAPLRSVRGHTIAPYAGFEVGAFSEKKAGGREHALVCTIK
jgi:hypothetical protein